MKLRFLLVVVGGLLLASPAAHAIARAESENASIEVIGSLRLTGAYIHFVDPLATPSTLDDALLASELRLLVTGNLAAAVSYEVHLFADLGRGLGGITSASFASSGAYESVYRLSYLAPDYWRRGAILGRAGLDRLRCTYKQGAIDISAGRFPINHSVTRVFAPNDFFAPFSAAAVNKVYKPGVDALQVGVETGEMSALELDAVLGYAANHAPAWGNSALMARVSTVLADVEWALSIGRIAQRWVAGASFQGEALGVGLRGEGHLGLPDRAGRFTLDDRDGDGRTRDDPAVHLAVGGDKTFTWRNTAVAVEYAYYSDGSANPDNYLGRAARLFPDSEAFLGKHYVGLAAGGEIIPILRIGILALMNVRDGSGLGMASLEYSIADEAAFVGGLLIPWGRQLRAAGGAAVLLPVPHSEFGHYPLTVYCETRFYF